MNQWKDGELEEYLDTFLKKYPCEAVSEIVYCSTLGRFADVAWRCFPGGRYAWTEERINLFWNVKMLSNSVANVVCDPYTLGLHRPTVILAFPPMKTWDQEETTSILRDHEYVHASDWAEGIPIGPKRRITLQNWDKLLSEIIRDIMEVRAYEHQFKAMPPEWEDRRIYQLAFKRYGQHVGELRSLLKTDLSSFERRVIKEFLTAHSSP